MIRILVGGDTVTEHKIFQGERAMSFSDKSGTITTTTMGGARLINSLLEIIYKPVKDISLVPPCYSNSNDEAFSLWEPCPDKSNSENTVWRATKQIGYGPRPSPIGKDKRSAANHTNRCNIAVFDDGGINFRYDRSTWPQFVSGKKDPNIKWVVLKMADPIGRGDLWAELRAKYERKLIVVVNADDLRREAVMISKARSWEHTVQDLLSELRTNAILDNLNHCRHLVVLFKSEGALWIENPGIRSCKPTVIIDPGNLEGTWESSLQGQVLGVSACFLGGVVGALTENIATPDMAKGIVAGLSARRRLTKLGYGSSENLEPALPMSDISAEIKKRLSTPHAMSAYSVVSVPGVYIPKLNTTPGSDGVGRWSMLEGEQSKAHRPLYGPARQVVRKGTKALKGIPNCWFGKLFTADRNELESLNGIRKLVQDYVDHGNASKPLSLGVFGPPGAGKSFGIKQIVKGILGKEVPILEFNLSQFKNQEMLIGAFHQVRDKALKGPTPVVFWDEFDSESLKWLQYLLAPMQDGAFIEGQITHPIGKCIFVFAGGTSYTMRGFSSQNMAENPAEFKSRKGPDFVSRLQGYLNVLGPNQRLHYDDASRDYEEDVNDIGYPIRRALLLRVMSGTPKNSPLEIDSGLLNGFLKIDHYRHGARSLETMIKLTADGIGHLVRSNIPPVEQIGIHIEHQQFVDLVQQDSDFQLKCKKLAPFIHKEYILHARRQGDKVSIPADFTKLEPMIQADNVDAALRIPEVLSLVGVQVVSSSDRRKALTLSEWNAIVTENIELMAEAEHEGWMKSKLANGWLFSETKDAKLKHHPLLIPYEALGEDNKEKDRNAVRTYPKIIKRAKFKIVYE
jgi:RyR domain/ATPase family associated with various cellular activities (AAA)